MNAWCLPGVWLFLRFFSTADQGRGCVLLRTCGGARLGPERHVRAQPVCIPWAVGYAFASMRGLYVPCPPALQ
eukprot:23534-Eustigmatos_ZCMA.PRE.1